MAEAKKVYRLNKKNGTTYIYLDQPYWDKDAQVPRHKMKGIGKVGPDGRDVYNDYYLGMIKKTNEVVSISRTIRLGERNVCEKAARATGVRAVLNKIFGKEQSEKMLALAFYEMCEGNALAYADDWMEQRGWDLNLSSQEISRLLSSITEDKMDEFFKAWIARNAERKSLLFDITSVSSYDRNNAYAEWGHNRDHENLEQVNIGLLSAYGSLVPMWYALMPGSISDVAVMDYLAQKLSKLGLEQVVITSDRGFYSDSNLKHLMEMHYKFTIPVPASVGWQKELIDDNVDKLYRPEYIIHPDDNTFIYGRTFCDNSSPYGRVWKHLYLDPDRKQREIKSFMARLEKARAELEENKLMERNRKFYETYFIVKDTPRRGRSVEVNGKSVDEFLNGSSCYWVLLSNTEKDAATALAHYRMRNDIELQFDDLKNTIDCNRLRTHNEGTMKGKVFVCFLSLIVLNELKKEVSAIPPQDRKHWTWKEILSKVSTYGKCSFTNKYKAVYTVPTKAQRMLFKALQIDYVWKGEKVAFNTEIEEDEQPFLDE